MQTRLHRRPRILVLVATLLTVAAVLAAAQPGVAAPAPEPVVAAGDNWTVSRAPGGYEVVVELDEALPVRSDAPTIVVDGQPLGIATESDDGLSLRVFTADRTVADAKEVEAGWASQSDAGPSHRSVRSEEAPPRTEAAHLAADPMDLGGYDWTESIYKFGDQAIDLAAIGGIRGELEGKIYLPTTGGARPTVVLLHGRHSYCWGPAPNNPNRWPCALSPDAVDPDLSIPSYLGYEGTARALASHGYAVVSISANAINANDNQLAADQGAQARGQLILDTLDLLKAANEGRPVMYHDAWTGRDVTLDQALKDGATALASYAPAFPGGVEELDAVHAGDLRGRFDLRHIGLMGHSRGGEGITSAVTLNQALAHPKSIESILPLAPVDFGRMTIPDVPMSVILPYCDGDVSNQQGQHMVDDSRYAFRDDVLRSAVWVMGANHNFFNTVWTPGLFSYSTSDDWSSSAARRTEPTCGTDPSVLDTSIRLTPEAQYEVGTAYMAGWFRLTLGGEEQFLPMFDGSRTVPAMLDGADVRSVSTAPSSSRSTLASFEIASPAVNMSGSATATVCASLAGRTVEQELPPCAETTPSSAAPHWTPASNGGNVPATPLTRFRWTSSNDALIVTLAPQQRSAARFERLSVKLAADETVTTGTDLTVTVSDSRGRTWSSLVSALNPDALVRMPTSSSPAAASTLKKLVLQQVDVPVATLARAGLSTKDLRSVKFTGSVGLDGTASGAAYISDLAFESSDVGTARTHRWNPINVYAPNVAEGDGPGTVEIAAYLSRPSSSPVTGYVSLLGSATGRAGIAMERVTFSPGESCKSVIAPILGDDSPSESAGTRIKASVINTSGAIMGTRAIVYMVVGEDDGVLGTATPYPSFGAPGDACEELAKVQTGTAIKVPGIAQPGTEVTVTATGFRAGEAVAFTVGDSEPVALEADARGFVITPLVVPADAGRALTVTAVGAGTGLTATGTIRVLDRPAGGGATPS